MVKRIVTGLLMICLIISCFACSSKRIKDYYEDQSVFQEITATIDGFYDDQSESNEICLSVDVAGTDFSSSLLYLSGENANAVRENHIWDVVRMGSEVTLSAARGQFWDGFHIQIVALLCDGNNLLEFDKGYQNLMDSLEFGTQNTDDKSSTVTAEESADLSYMEFHEALDGTCRSVGAFCGVFYDSERQVYSLYFCHESSFTAKDLREPFILQGDALTKAIKNELFNQIQIGSICFLSSFRDSDSSLELTSIVLDNIDYLA